MNSINSALLVNLVGFAVGVGLYGMIAVMVLRLRRSSRLENVDRLLLTTAALGLAWNIGELYTFVQKDFALGEMSQVLIAVSFACLGFLPSVVVHSAQADEDGPHWLTYLAYALSGFAACLHLYSAVILHKAPSDLALQTLTVGSIALAAGLLLFNLRQTLEKKTIWASALLVFAVSALHLTGESEGSRWYIELAAHQSSLLLALTILYQNYRFAFADLFLKRAISLILLALTASGLYVLVASPLLHLHETHERDDPQAIGIILALWIGTALIYPLLHRLAVWLVDRVILHRADYANLRDEIAREIELIESPGDVLKLINQRLAVVFSANSSGWTVTQRNTGEIRSKVVTYSPNEARIALPTTESPFYELNLADFIGGRRLLSDEVATLESISVLAARRIDLLRVMHERCEREFREEQFAKLATEAQLTALRSQINPHFLFNALTTIGYLIKAEPEKAYDTLLRLTRLLRRVLSSTGEFCTLGEEVGLVESYLEIERARFEEKLRVNLAIPPELTNIQVPALILQPLVENAIKHGISENKCGGEIKISATKLGENGDAVLKLSVWDSGAGTLRATRKDPGLGLRNIEERLASYYGNGAGLTFAESNGEGTTVVIKIPIKNG